MAGYIASMYLGSTVNPQALREPGKIDDAPLKRYSYISAKRLDFQGWIFNVARYAFCRMCHNNFEAHAPYLGR